MRKDFFNYHYELMKVNPDIWAITGDLGYIGFDKIRDEFPGRFLNVGASEQVMLGIACGLALKGKIPVVYSITPFLLYRAFETIRTYINHEPIPVILVGSGRDKDYAHDGFSHDASDDKDFLQHFSNLVSIWPEDSNEMKRAVNAAVSDGTNPSYINLRR